MTAQEKLKKIREKLKQIFLERSDLIDGALSALLASQHVPIIGPLSPVAAYGARGRITTWLLKQFRNSQRPFLKSTFLKF